MPIQKYILVLNCGSSSIKFSILDAKNYTIFLHGLIESIGKPQAAMTITHQDGTASKQQLADINYNAALKHVFTWLTQHPKLSNALIAVGHRVVHGGEKFTQATLITEEVLQTIYKCNHLAPLHNPHNLCGIKAAQKKWPNLPQVAAFDTAFHHSMPKHTFIYPLPFSWYQKHAVRRYGFHGTSHQYVTEKAATIIGKPYSECAFISAHLGNGCSACAVLHGKSVDTTMGLTPLSGLMMGTRSGDIDPGLHSYLQENLDLNIQQITAMLNKQSGLLGVSEHYSDMRNIEKYAQQGDKQAQLALTMFCYILAKNIAALSVALNGKLDALIFTAGIGENSILVRHKTVNLLKILGLEIDEQLNLQHGQKSNYRINTKATPNILVIPTNEELMIAKETSKFIG